MNDYTPPPITVPSSAAPDQLKGALRTALVGLGAYGVGKGWFDANLVSAVIPVVLIAAPAIWQQLKVLANHRKMVAIATASPDAVAKVV